MVALVAVLVGILGLAIGSFGNVVAYRVPLGKSVVRPPSACPNCGHPIRARDNVPVLSWLLLRGRCRHCGELVSARYPVVELSTALLFAATVLVVGVRWVLPAYLWFVAAGVVLTITDLDHQRIPNRILFPSLGASTVLLVVGAVLDGAVSDLPRALAGAAGYFALLFIVAVAARGGFGFGDVKLALLLGLFLAFRSWGALASGIFLAFAIGGLIAIGLLATRRKGRRDAMPFGPSLIAGAFLGVAWGDRLFDWYVG